MEIQENISLKPYTRMHTGGNARFFVSVESVEELTQALSWVRERGLPSFVLGGGSNTLVSDDGFDGLVIHINLRGVEYINRGDFIEGVFAAGESWDGVVADVTLRNLWGVENLSLIPGSVGGAVVQNIGAYGVELKDSVLWVEAFNTNTNMVVCFDREVCNFGYRTSVFKTQPELVVLRVALRLSKTPYPRTDYEDMRKFFEAHEGNPESLLEIREAVIAIRTQKMPGEEVGTLGSYFKNPVISKAEADALVKAFPDIKTYPVSEKETKISAAWLIDHLGNFRGVRRGDAGVHERQALILVNYGNATTNEMLLLAQEIKNLIREKTNINLEEEVVLMKK